MEGWRGGGAAVMRLAFLEASMGMANGFTGLGVLLEDMIMKGLQAVVAPGNCGKKVF